MSILIVEDEASVRFVAAEMIADTRYEVLESANADEAIRLLEQSADVQLVLLSDIRTPGTMDGMELARLVHDRWPKIRILLTSANIRLRDADIPDDGGFLAKPYNVSTLLGKIAGLDGLSG